MIHAIAGLSTELVYTATSTLDSMLMITQLGQSCKASKDITNGPAQMQAISSGSGSRLKRRSDCTLTVTLPPSCSTLMHRWPHRTSAIMAADTAAADRLLLSTVVADTPNGTRSNAAVSDKVLPSEAFDVVVIGAGVGGLSCAAMLAYYGFKVVVCESHSVAGGAAHCWTRRGCHFDSGTALFFGLPAAASSSSTSAQLAVAAGLATAAAAGGQGSRCTDGVIVPGPSDNPLAAVLTVLGEHLDVVTYGPERTCLVFPEGKFAAQIGSELFSGVVRQLWGDQAQQEWCALQQLCRDLAAAAVALHPMVVRYDPWVALTAVLRRPARFARSMAAKPPLLGDQVMFSELVGSVVRSPVLKSFIDVLCQGTSGALAADIPAAYMVRAFAEMYQPGTQLQWPRGGPQAIADALVRGLRKHGGKLLLGCHVSRVIAGPGGRAAGVQLRGGGSVGAGRAVVSNASLWDTQRLVPQQALLPQFEQQVSDITAADSFVHLHAVINLPSQVDPQQLPVHSYYLSPGLVGRTGWPTLTISTAVNNTLAPAGKQVLHAYMAEPFMPWQNLTRGSRDYQELKQLRAEVLWGLVEQVVPGARSWLDWQDVGTPLTHQHFRRRYRGAYGATNSSSSSSRALSGMQPHAVQAMKGLYCCGDCTFPYIGTPAVAASGMWVANSLAPVWRHWQALNLVDPSP